MIRKRAWEIGAAAVLILVLTAAVTVAWAWQERQEQLTARLAVALDADWVTGAKDLSGLRRLVSQGASLRVHGRRLGLTVLHVACLQGDQDLTAESLRAEADVNAKAVAGFTPLMAAAVTGHPGITRMLIAAGGEVNARDRFGTAVLTHAVFGRRATILRLLEDAPSTSRAPGGSSARQRASSAAAATVQVLIEGGAEVNARDRYGHTALEYAANPDQFRTPFDPAVIRVLKQHRAKE
jgi:uncharacterized protein